MTGLVLELQSDALNPEVAVDDLLRKALVVSRKLGLSEVQEWVGSELGGYATGEVPPYREIRGELKFFNPVQGRWVPAHIPHDDLADSIRKQNCFQSVGELRDLLAGNAKVLLIKFPAGAQQQLMDMFQEDMEPALHVPRQAFVKVLDAVRNKVLDWSLDLEARQILGSGLTFSPGEKQSASQIHYNTVNNIGSMTSSQIQQHSPGQQTMHVDTQGLKTFADALDAALKNLKLPAEVEQELTAEIKTLRAQIDSPKPKSNVLRVCLGSVKEILEGAAGNVLATGLLAHLAPLIGAFGS